MLTFNVVLTMMMMTRVLMSPVDVDDSGVNSAHSDRVELEEIMMTLVLTVVMTMMILVLMMMMTMTLVVIVMNLVLTMLGIDDDQSIMSLILMMTGF